MIETNSALIDVSLFDGRSGNLALVAFLDFRKKTAWAAGGALVQSLSKDHPFKQVNFMVSQIHTAGKFDGFFGLLNLGRVAGRYPGRGEPCYKDSELPCRRMR
jgi:hypothetical protein